MNNLRHGSGPILQPLGVKLAQNQTVFDDAEVDLLFGGADQDWYFANRAQDNLRGRARNEAIG